MSGIFVHEQVKALEDQGIEVKVIAPVPYVPFFIKRVSNKWQLYDKIPSFELIEGIEVYHTKYIALPNGVLKDYWAYVLFTKVMKLINSTNELQNFDLIHAHGAIPIDYSAYLMSHKLKLPYIVTVHGETVNQIIHSSRKFRKSKKALLNAAAVIGVSSKVVNQIQEYTGRKRKVFKVFNGYKKVEIIERSPITHENLIILFAGNLVKSKGCDYLLRAFSELVKKYSQIHLVIAGGGELLNEMKSLVYELRIQNRVTFTGALPHTELLSHMSQCDIFILPSVDEGFGVVYLEAMSFKKPVIGTEGEGICDILKDNFNGLLVKPRNVESIKSKLELLINSEDLRNKLGDNGYNTVKELTWERNASETINIYKEIISSP
jgi:glycosyltransferase involved in cell wall biosynthesis